MNTMNQPNTQSYDGGGAKINVLMSCFIQVSYLFDQALQQQHHYLYKGILQQISIDILIKLEDV